MIENELILSLTKRAFQQYADELLPSSALTETIQTIEDERERGVQYIVDSKQNPRGIVRIETKGESLYFFRLAVIPEARRQNIATDLLRRIEEEATVRQLHSIHCHVRAHTIDNISFYKKRGFIITKEWEERRGNDRLRIVAMEKRI